VYSRCSPRNLTTVDLVGAEDAFHARTTRIEVGPIGAKPYDMIEAVGIQAHGVIPTVDTQRGVGTQAGNVQPRLDT
jgi:hypothetical protein